MVLYLEQSSVFQCAAHGIALHIIFNVIRCGTVRGLFFVFMRGAAGKLRDCVSKCKPVNDKTKWPGFKVP